MSPEQFQALNESVQYIRGRVDDTGKQLTDFRVEQTKELGELRVSVEHRLTKVEVKSGLWGMIGGFLAGIAYHLKR